MFFEDAEDAEVSAILSASEANEIPKNKSVGRYLSCPRCGAVGHGPKDCRGQLPTTEDMMKEIERKISMAVGSAPREWKRDELGHYLPCSEEGNEPDRTKSWADGVFCFNCGEFGHEEGDCSGPTREEIRKMMGDLTDRSSAGLMYRRMVINKIRQRQGKVCE